MKTNEKAFDIEKTFLPGEKELMLQFVERQCSSNRSLGELNAELKKLSKSDLEHLICETAFEVRGKCAQRNIPATVYYKILWAAEKLVNRVNDGTLSELQVLAFKLSAASVLSEDFLQFHTATLRDPRKVSSLLDQAMESPDIKKLIEAMSAKSGIPVEVVKVMLAADVSSVLPN